MEIRLTIGSSIVTATLLNSEASRDFVHLLPLTLTLEDYARREKVSDLPAPLSIEDAPPGFDPSRGDITYYAPWGNLAIFYRNFGYSSGLVRLGTIDRGVETFDVPGALDVTIDIIERGMQPLKERNQYQTRHAGKG